MIPGYSLFTCVDEYLVSDTISNSVNETLNLNMNSNSDCAICAEYEYMKYCSKNQWKNWERVSLVLRPQVTGSL